MSDGRKLKPEYTFSAFEIHISLLENLSDRYRGVGPLPKHCKSVDV